MYSRYKLRRTKKFIMPKGPKFSRAKIIICDIDGVTIKFKAPKHRPSVSNNESILPSRRYKTDEIVFRSSFSRCETFDFFYHAWSFYGPWFTGSVAELRLHFDLITSINIQNKDTSLFHPRVFESAISDYLTDMFSKFKNDLMGNRQEYIAPLKWQPLAQFPVVAVRFQVEPDEKIARHTVQYFLFFPISDKVMACLQFVPSQFLALSQEELDKRVSREPMHELMNNIIDSIEVTLSADALARQQKALEGLDDTSLVKEFLPLKWDDTKTGSTPPKSLEDVGHS